LIANLHKKDDVRRAIEAAMPLAGHLDDVQMILGEHAFVKGCRLVDPARNKRRDSASTTPAAPWPGLFVRSIKRNLQRFHAILTSKACNPPRRETISILVTWFCNIATQ